MDKPKKVNGYGKYIVQLRLAPEEYEMLQLLARKKGGPGYGLSTYLKTLIYEKHEEVKGT
jgi:hypothetical protein